MAKKNPAIIKRDSRTNWEKSKYVPEENVIIIMDNPDGTVSLMIGNGEQNVNQLPDLIKSSAAATEAQVTEDNTLIL